MDCKMGTTSYEEDTKLAKKLKQGAADVLSTTSELGVRICGLQCYQVKQDNFIKKDKSWGVSLTAQTFGPFLKVYLQNGVSIRYDVAKKVVEELKKIEAWFNVQSKFKFYGCSILFVYDGIVPPSGVEPKVNVRMMDFAHVIETTDGTLDTSYLKGLHTLISAFNLIVAEGEHASKIQTPHVF